jgi:hypothetical protein
MTSNLATHGLIATEASTAAGAIVWWRLVGEMDLDMLRAAWAAEGLPEAWLPDYPSATVALRRAVSEQTGPRRLLRAHKGALVLVDEYERADDLGHETILRVELNLVGRPSFSKVLPGLSHVAHTIESDFNRLSTHLIHSDISPWLCRIMERVDAVALRETGGIYFVPRFRMPVWEAVVRAVRRCGAHVVSSVPAMQTREAVAAVLDALAQEAAGEVAAIEKDIAEGLGARGLKNRVKATEAVERKLAAYEGLLGEKLEALRSTLEATRGNIAIAIIQAEADEAAA